MRVEDIRTQAIGYFKRYVLDAAGNIVVENTINENIKRDRNFILGGIGLSYKLKDYLEFYSNFSQNYRAINFTDIRVVNPNFIVDPNIKDEKGYTADVGMRGRRNGVFMYEVTAFYISYQGKLVKYSEQINHPCLTITD